MTRRVPLGQVVATPAALRALEEAGQSAIHFLWRHEHCDWGEVCDEDHELNEQSVCGEGRLMSVYSLRTGTTIWIITEWDRSVTTVLLPEDY